MKKKILKLETRSLHFEKITMSFNFIVKAEIELHLDLFFDEGFVLRIVGLSFCQISLGWNIAVGPFQ